MPDATTTPDARPLPPDLLARIRRIEIRARRLVANIFVGESRPVISSYQNTGTNTGNVGAGYTSNVNYREIGIRLTVKPLIGQDGSVQLDIKQSDSQPAEPVEST